MYLKVAVALWLVGLVSASGQTLDRFEVASFKLSEYKPGEAAPAKFDSLPGSRIVIRNLSLNFVIRDAFGVIRDDLLQGAPSWLDDRYNIEAKGNSPKELSDAEFKPALQSLLIERLHLTTHWETKDTPVFLLVVAPDGQS